MKQCRECGHEVSTSAKACPECGATKPTQGSVQHGLQSLGSGAMKVGCAIVLIPVLALIIGTCMRAG